MRWLCGAVFVLVLLYSAIDDVRTHTVDDRICILIALAGLIHFSPASLFGALLCALPFYIGAGCGQIGAGDVRLAAAVGFALGPGGALLGFAFMLVCLFPYAIFAHTKQRVPLVPFFALGFIPAYFII